jgi:alpha-tubulin suppressor-like RCC1 family protein
MPRWWVLVLVVLLGSGAGCGRIGYTRLDTSDASQVDAYAGDVGGSDAGEDIVDSGNDDPCVPSVAVAACDADGDGVGGDVDPNNNDSCVPSVAVATCDADGDGVGGDVDPNNSDSCVPSVAVATCDADGDGVGGDVDPNNSDSCVPSVAVATCDADGDGVGGDVDPNNSDPCVPSVAVATCDADGDGVGGDADPNNSDPCVPSVAVATCDADGDGVGGDVDPNNNNACVPSPAHPACNGPACGLDLASVVESASGWYHTCALTSSGGVKCFGRNSNGQLGDGSTTGQTTPVDVVGMSGGVRQVVAADFHTCALSTAGGVKCWGWNRDGQLGDGTTSDRTTPVDVTGLTTGVVQISVGGGGSSCAVTVGGGVKCWGSNPVGQLGDGTQINRSTPVDVVGLTSGVVRVEVGDGHACALTITGGVKCWGQNGDGQLGDGTATDSTTAVDVVGLTTGVRAIGAGYLHTCAVTNTDTVKCWGRNGDGQIGDGTTTNQTQPADVIGLGTGVKEVALGAEHTCALTLSGGMKCWGQNVYGQLGDGTTGPMLPPVDVIGLGIDVVHISTGDKHSCAVLASGGMECWGLNEEGRVGDGTPFRLLVPVDVAGLGSSVRSISSGYRHSCVVTVGGAVQCWGSNLDGQLGDGTTLNPIVPTDTLGLTVGMAKTAEGADHSCALSDAGGVKCWGNNDVGQLGDGTAVGRLSPVDVSGLSSGMVEIDIGDNHSCAVTSLGGAKCWGTNANGQLGDGSTTDRSTPIDVVSLGVGLRLISGGGHHTCGLTNSGGVKCWGSNTAGQLGDGTTTQRQTAVDVFGLSSGVVQIGTGHDYSCALTNTGGVKCWGDNGSGQLGDGTSTQGWTPVNVQGLTSGVVEIAVGAFHACALTTADLVKCWGKNDVGQLGDGTITGSTVPTDVLGLSNVMHIAAGDEQTCALLNSGAVQCWGSDAYGQTTAFRRGYGGFPAPVCDGP